MFPAEQVHVNPLVAAGYYILDSLEISAELLWTHKMFCSTPVMVQNWCQRRKEK